MKSHSKLSLDPPCILCGLVPCEPCKDLAKVEKRVLETVAVLADLEKTRQSLRARVNRVHASLIQRVPLEIAAIIFEYSVADYEEDSDLWRNHRSPYKRIKLGHICRSWREIAWSTPTLWNTISIKIRHRFEKPNMTMWQEWLDRSGNLPLSIDLKSPYYGSADGLEYYRPLMDLINHYSCRWRSLRAIISPDLLCRLHGPDTPSPSMVDTLIIIPTAEIGEVKSMAKFSLQNARPSPKYVEIGGILLKSFDISWNNVTHMVVSSENSPFFCDECLEVFRQAPQLVKCKLDRIMVGRGGYIPTSVITLNCLRCLEINHASDVSIQILFDLLLLPSLEEYSHDSNNGSFPVASFVSLVERSGCSLKKMVLTDTDYEAGTIVELCSVVPSLEELQIYTFDGEETDTESLLAQLGETSILACSGTGKSASFLPDLRKLSIEGLRPFRWATLAKIFGSQYDGLPVDQRLDEKEKGVNEQYRPLRSIHIDSNGFDEEPVGKELIPRFTNAARRGVEFTGDWLLSSIKHRGITLEEQDRERTSKG
ncbi:hypothetical protein GALMADRAFT_226243 [Galerina marginata CBS 339.88]|uniref:Uncharacterized protein n=1 Tax=Galerina marginata (strain CBS 339.88) TaxID=685588 RepID=A0A067SXJ6_GALM3|nr:hypothetical protein GALMADRAFT_226243 [Galerina marginata CBS 339.88]